jgi:hypothetical protein
MQTYDGEAFHTMAHHNSPPQFVEFLRTPLRPMPGMASDRIVRGEDVVTFLETLQPTPRMDQTARCHVGSSN